MIFKTSTLIFIVLLPLFVKQNIIAQKENNCTKLIQAYDDYNSKKGSASAHRTTLSVDSVS